MVGAVVLVAEEEVAVAVAVEGVYNKAARPARAPAKALSRQ